MDLKLHLNLAEPLHRCAHGNLQASAIAFDCRRVGKSDRQRANLDLLVYQIVVGTQFYHPLYDRMDRDKLAHVRKVFENKVGWLVYVMLQMHLRISLMRA